MKKKRNINTCVFCRFVVLITFLVFIFSVMSCGGKQSLQYNNIRALLPEPTLGPPNAPYGGFAKVDSLKPTFKWVEEKISKPSYYEFAIWTLEKNVKIEFSCNFRTPGHISIYQPEDLDCNLINIPPNCAIACENYSLNTNDSYFTGPTASLSGAATCVSDKPYYFREVKDTNHTIERELIPNTFYLWSVRPIYESTSGTQRAEWGTLNSYISSKGIGGYTAYRRKNCFFGFKTPKK